MALVVKDRVMETTSSTGTGTITLGGSVAGYQSFSVVGDGNTTYYAIDGGSEWEVGIGTYTASGTTLSRDTVLESSNSGSLVNFSSGTKNVFVTYPAEKSVYKESNDYVYLPSNLEFTGTGSRITGDFSNSTLANRVLFQTSTTNGNTSLGILPNGTSTSGFISVFNNSTPTNASVAQLASLSTDFRLNATITGTGSYLPMTFYTNGSERMRIDTLGNVVIGANATNSRLEVSGSVVNTISDAGTEDVATLTITNRDVTSTGRIAKTLYQIGNLSLASVSGIYTNFNATNDIGGALAFSTQTNASGGVVERMRITSNGGVSFGSSGTAYGTSGQVLTSNGDAPPTWTTISSGSGTVTSITAGTGLTGGTITTSGTIAVDTGVVATLTGTQTLTNKTINGAILNNGYTEEVFAITDGASVVLDPNNGSIQTWTLGASRTPTVANWNNGQSMTLMVNDGASNSITWSGVSNPPVIVGSTSASFGSSTSGTITLPTGLLQGDIVIVGVGSDDASPALPSGWTNIQNLTSGTEQARTFYKVMGATPDTSVTITTVATASCAFSVAIRLGNAASIISSNTGGTSGMPNPPSLASVAANSIVLAMGFLDDDNVASNVTAPNGYTLIESRQSSTVGQTVMVAFTLATTAGTYDPPAFGGTGDDEWVAFTVAVPASGGVVWVTDGGAAPILSTGLPTPIVLWETDNIIYGAKVGNA